MKKISILAVMLLVIMVCFTGCTEYVKQPTLQDTLKQSAEQIAQNQQTLEQKQPAPRITYSNERANLIKRATTFNQPNKVSYIYLVSNNGSIMAFYTVKGKVSSISSYLVPDEQIVEKTSMSTTNAFLTIQAPDIDGSYGTNGGGIFFYTTDDTYVEWNGEYMLCDKPLKMATQPVLLRDIK
jgi:hypothetical protein